MTQLTLRFFQYESSFSLSIMTKSRKIREAAISEPFLDRLFF